MSENESVLYKDNGKPYVYTSAKGIAIYPWINKADKKYNKDGEYRVKLSIPEAEAADMMELFKKAHAEACELKFEENKAKIKKRAKMKEADVPFKMEEDDEGEETGNVIFNFKMHAKGKNKDGDEFTRQPKVFDAKGKNITENAPAIYGGSALKVAYTLAPFYTAQLGAGVTVRLQAVQVIELVNSSGASADSYGFGEEDGYEADDSDNAFSDSSDDDSDAEDDDDF